ncbi:hypothetical protein J2129_000110 [Methanofollis sp. W23]|nr:hypothetical protein [Methanofollis sp. W23]
MNIIIMNIIIIVEDLDPPGEMRISVDLAPYNARNFIAAGRKTLQG